MPTLRGTLRAVAADRRRAERAAQRRRRELLKQQQLLAKEDALARAKYEVEVYENQVSVLTSVHTESSDDWDWKSVKTTPMPLKPEMSNDGESMARKTLEQYSPGLIDKALRKENKKREELSRALDQAKEDDKRKYQEALQQYEQDLAEWEKMQQVAEGVLSGQPAAYITAIEETNPFSDIAELGSSMKFQTDADWYIEAFLHVNDEQTIPSEEKTLLKSGKLSVKKMAKGKFYELYQDHICSCAIRVARELFALLPVQMVFVHTMGKQLNPKTGHKELNTILSVAMPRETLSELNLDLIDCSDSMDNFVNRMSFSRTKGFSSVESLKPQDFSPTS